MNNLTKFFSVCIALSLSSLTFAAATLTNQEKVSSAFKNIERSFADADRYETIIMDEKFIASKDVFSPKYFKSTEMLTANFPFKANEKFLEVGCGIGVAAVIAAKNHHNKVIALDINPVAVKLTTENAAKHGVARLVEARESNVFSKLADNEKFDTIFWDLPYVYTESNQEKDLTLLQRSVSDPGYRHIEMFLAQAPLHLNANGRIIVGFGSNGDLERFMALANKHQYNMNRIYEGFNPYREGITYQLYLLTPKTEMA
ncbi:MAG: methyltransferase [Candidatus Berkiella sp.]